MDNIRKLFVSENYKLCSMCSRPLPVDFEKDCCPACEENILFKEVREYIRSHDVTEYQLAEVFNLSPEKVKKWIKDGRIEYVQTEQNKIVSARCQRCGAAVSFGTLCPACLRLMNGEKQRQGVAMFKQNRDGSRIRSLGDEIK